MTDKTTKEIVDTSLSSLHAISPLDGRYQTQVMELQNIFSEFGLIKHRLIVETKWFETLLKMPEIGVKITEKHKQSLLEKSRKMRENFEVSAAQKIKAFEKITNHDVKAVEYFLKENLLANSGSHESHEASNPALSALLHFACTSDDINNLAYALMIKEARKTILLPKLDEIVNALRNLAHQYADTPMLARTHGQPATPTTVGKEFANFAVRLQKQCAKLAALEIMGKFNGATGNFSAHSAAFPEVNWQEVCQKFVEDFGLNWNLYTTQIEPHDYIVEISNLITHINNILIGFCRDMWGYISLNYFTQVIKSDQQIGSSVMPHKINPIDFENAEGNLGLANALFLHFANKLPISRWQRDLTDSTVLRNIGVNFAYCLIAYKSILKGLSKTAVNQAYLEAELDQHWEVLSEAIQTTMRAHGTANAYEELRSLTRGKKIDRQIIAAFIDNLDLPVSAKERLKSLTPTTYLGLATTLARDC